MKLLNRQKLLSVSSLRVTLFTVVPRRETGNYKTDKLGLGWLPNLMLMRPSLLVLILAVGVAWLYAFGNARIKHRIGAGNFFRTILVTEDGEFSSGRPCPLP